MVKLTSLFFSFKFKLNLHCVKNWQEWSHFKIESEWVLARNHLNFTTIPPIAVTNFLTSNTIDSFGSVPFYTIDSFGRVPFYTCRNSSFNLTPNPCVLINTHLFLEPKKEENNSYCLKPMASSGESGQGNNVYTCSDLSWNSSFGRILLDWNVKVLFCFQISTIFFWSCQLVFPCLTLILRISFSSHHSGPGPGSKILILCQINIRIFGKDTYQWEDVASYAWHPKKRS